MTSWTKIATRPGRTSELSLDRISHIATKSKEIDLKRVITPINIENYGITIKSPSELLALAESEPLAYALTCKSGDAERLLHSFGKSASDYPLCPDLDLSHYLDPDIDPFAAKGSVIVHGAVYTSRTKKIEEDVEITGYHRQKSLIDLDGHSILTTAVLSLRYLTLATGVITISSGARLRIRNAFLDRVKIVIEAGGRLELIDIEMSGNTAESIRVEKGGTISLFKDVRFFDVHKKFYIECATMEETGTVLDITDADAIISFLDESIVRSIELISDFNPITHSAFSLRQPIVFINKSIEKLAFKVQHLDLDHDLRLDGLFQTQCDITIIETPSISLVLAEYCGTIDVNDCDDLRIGHTSFRDSGARLQIHDTDCTLEHCLFDNSARSFSGSRVALRLLDTRVLRCSELFEFSTPEVVDQDRLLVNTRLRENEVTWKGSEIIASNDVMNSDQLHRITLQHTSIQNSKDVIVVEEAQIILDDIHADSIENLLDVKRSIVEANDVRLVNGTTAITLKEGSKAIFKKGHIKGYQEQGIAVLKSTLELRHVTVTHNHYGVTLDEEPALLRHYDCVFSENVDRDINDLYGSKVIDLKEVEGLQQWKTA